MKLSSTLSWADKLVLVQQYELTEVEACAAFGVSKQELVVAKNLQAKGVFTINETLNTAIYSDYFVKLRSGELETSEKTFKPKGARTSKITQAFEAITNTPQKVDAIIEQYGVSLAVLRQSKRFDKGNVGQIHIRKDKETNDLMVWRDAE
jgi:hypothetical protein